MVSNICSSVKLLDDFAVVTPIGRAHSHAAGDALRSLMAGRD